MMCATHGISRKEDTVEHICTVSVFPHWDTLIRTRVVCNRPTPCVGSKGHALLINPSRIQHTVTRVKCVLSLFIESDKNIFHKYSTHREKRVGGWLKLSSFP